MRRDVAVKVLSLMLEYGAKLDDTLALVQRNCTPDEFERFRTTVGQVMALMLLDVMNPIFAEHPDLKPDQLK